MDTKKLWYVALGLLLLIVCVLAVDDMQVKGANKELFDAYSQCLIDNNSYYSVGLPNSPPDTNVVNNELINNVFN
jgi:hypothetical protein